MNRGQLFALSVFTLLAVGCAAPRSGHSSFFAATNNFSRIAIACVDVRTSGEPYDQKRAQARVDREPEVAREVANTARIELSSRGYSIAESRPVIRLSGSNSVEPQSADWIPLLVQAEAQAFNKRLVEEPFDERVQLDARTLLDPEPEADAWLFLLTEANFEYKRVKAKKTGSTAAAISGAIVLGAASAVFPPLAIAGMALDQKKDPPNPEVNNWTKQAFILVDPKSGQILWSAWKKYYTMDPRSDSQLKSVTQASLSSLPRRR